MNTNYLTFRVYNFLSLGRGATDVAALLGVMQRGGHGTSSSILNETGTSLRSTLLQHGMSETLVDELATVAVRVNYGQGLDYRKIHQRNGRESFAFCTDTCKLKFDIH